jgi:glycosyltransferase involved in cell wall biosynthesis
VRILVTSGIFPPEIGGPATHVADLRAELVRRGHEVEVLTLTDRARPIGVDGVFRLPRRWAWPVRSAVALVWVARHARRFDVIYATGLAPVAVAGSRIARRPVVLKVAGDPAWERGWRRGLTTDEFESFQDSVGGRPALRAMRRLRNWTVRRGTAVITPSAHLAEGVRSWGAHSVTVVPNGARVMASTLDRPAEQSPGLNALFVGRLVPVKRVDVILDAVARVDAVRLEIIGDGPELVHLRRHATERGLEHRAVFTGAFDHERVLARLAAADVLLLASEHEGLPHVVVEALASGTPVVAARAGGITEAVTDGVDGLLVPRPTPEDLAAALRRLAFEPDLLETLRSGALETGGRWQFDRCADRIEALLRDAAHSRPRAVFVGKSKMSIPPRPEDGRKYEIHERYMRTTVICTGSRAALARPGGATVLAMPAFGIPIFGTAAFYGLAPMLALALTAGRARSAIVCQSPYEAFGVIALRSLLPAAARPRVQVELHGDWRTATRLYGSPRRRKLSRLADSVAVWSLRRADRVRAVSEVLADLACSAGYRGPIDRHVTFSDFHEFLATDPVSLPAQPNALFVGVLERYKGLEVLLDAWPSVIRALPDARLTLVGAGRLYHDVRKRVHDTELVSSVRILAPMPRPELRRLLDASSCLVLPSRSEGLPRIVLEGMARGRPVVATKVGGFEELVEDGSNGRLVAPEDAPGLARALVAVLGDPAASAAMGAVSRSRAIDRNPAHEYEAGICRLAEWIEA